MAVALIALLTWNGWMAFQLAQTRSQMTTERRFWIVGHAVYPAAQRAEAFIELALAGNTDWKGAHLQELNLFGIKLPDADLQQAGFTATDLRRSDLSGARLTKATFVRADLTGANLAQAQLTGTDFTLARLIGADLRRANLRGAMLEQIQAKNATFIAADLAETDLLMADLSGANLSGADLSGADLEAASFANATLTLTRVPGVKLKDNDFTDSNWWRARGWASDQLAMLKQKFPPSAGAPEALKKDYDAWLKNPGATN
jgi:uncharacterized protein YjbI with pentapeptide repeats